jgi:hypothetical protein
MTVFLSNFRFFSRGLARNRNDSKSLRFLPFVEIVDFVAGNKREWVGKRDLRILSNFVSCSARARSLCRVLSTSSRKSLDTFDKNRPSAMVAAERHSATLDRLNFLFDGNPRRLAASLTTSPTAVAAIDATAALPHETRFPGPFEPERSTSMSFTHTTAIDAAAGGETQKTRAFDCSRVFGGSVQFTLAGATSPSIDLALEGSDAVPPNGAIPGNGGWEPPDASWVSLGVTGTLSDNGTAVLKADGTKLLTRWMRATATPGSDTGGTMTVEVFLRDTGA